jgi:hypothetical protein
MLKQATETVKFDFFGKVELLGEVSGSDLRPAIRRESLFIANQ